MGQTGIKSYYKSFKTKLWQFLHIIEILYLYTGEIACFVFILPNFGTGSDMHSFFRIFNPACCPPTLSPYSFRGRYPQFV